MKRRDFLKIGMAAASTVALPSCAQIGTLLGKRARPNVLLIITDDQRADTLSCAGNRILQTPAIDRLASQGVRFENMFVTTSTCSPSRASIFTGKYAHTHGAIGIGSVIPPGQRTLFEMLRDAGYCTGHVGKWHLTAARAGLVPEADRRGIDDWHGIGAFAPYLDKSGKHHTDWEAEQAIAFLDKRPQDRPFFLCLATQAPHAPYVPPPRLESMFRDVTIPEPPMAKEGFKRLPQAVQHSAGRTYWEREVGTPALYQETMKNYYRQIAGVDEAVGRVLAALDQQGLADNTLVVYTSDNGLLMGEHGLAEKWFPFEPGLRVPLIVKYPPLTKALQNRVRSEMALNIDIAPTILNILNMPMPNDIQGGSLAPLMGPAKGKTPWRKSFLYEYHCPSKVPPLEAVRTGRWKYIVYYDHKDPGFKLEQLFDFINDPLEINDLSASPEHKGTMEQMRSELAKLHTETNYKPWGTHPKSDWKPNPKAKANQGGAE